MKKFLFFLAISTLPFLATACGGDEAQKDTQSEVKQDSVTVAPKDSSAQEATTQPETEKKAEKEVKTH